jgi:hypothetical protein
MPTDDRFHLVPGNIRPLDNDLIRHHDGGCCRKIQLEVFIGLVFDFELGNGFDFNGVLFTQPGHHFQKILSRLPVRLIQEKSHFQHLFSPFYAGLNQLYLFPHA